MDLVAHPGRVLVVDGDAATLAAVESGLKSWFGVSIASSADEAEAVLESAEFDVVVTDYLLPGPSGMALVRSINAQFPSVKVIFLTRHVDVVEVVQAEKSQAVVRVLAKPLDTRRLISWVASSVKLSRMSRSTAELKNFFRKAPITVD